jgi:Uma2 family endonuclease
MAAPKFWHQELGDEMAGDLRGQIRRTGRGFVATAVAVFVPAPPNVIDPVQCRVPDIVISSHRVREEYPVGNPPEWVIEILSTRRGNVERTEKMDDYARAGIQEYWLVNAIDREVEVYALSAGDYTLVRKTAQPQSITFPGVEIDLTPYWPDPADF